MTEAEIVNKYNFFSAQVGNAQVAALLCVVEAINRLADIRQVAEVKEAAPVATNFPPQPYDGYKRK